jgi:predicted histone-like DNA-binding protein
MPVKFNVMARHNPLKPEDAKKFYAVVKSDGEITFKQLSRRIASMCTVNSGVMQEELAQGRIVRMGEFGNFSLTLSSEGKEKLEEVNAHSIKSARLQFRPGKDLKSTISGLEFAKV